MPARSTDAPYVICSARFRLARFRLNVVAALCATLFLLLTIPAPASAQPTLRAEVFVVPPFVIDQADRLTGFGIELWEEAASRLKAKTIYLKEPAPTDAALRANKVDLLVSPVFITVERDRDYDFSYPILDAGQQVMVRGTSETAAQNPLDDLLSLLFSKTAAIWLGVGLVLVLVPAHIVWLLERRHPEGIIPTKSYYPGLFHAIYWSVSTLLTQAEQMPRQWLARVIALLWMFTGVVFVALYTAQLTATLTVQQIRGPINGPDDLPGKRIGTIEGSVSATYLRDHNARVHAYANAEEMFQALLDKKVDALLYAAPVLRYFAAREGKGLVRMVGPEFNKEGLGIAFPNGSPLRRQVNNALIAMREDGTYQRIYEKWFGSDVQAGNE